MTATNTLADGSKGFSDSGEYLGIVTHLKSQMGTTRSELRLGCNRVSYAVRHEILCRIPPFVDAVAHAQFLGPAAKRETR